MQYNYKKIRTAVAREVKRICFSPQNKYTNTVWDYHILPAVKHSLALGKKIKADLEVVEISALLHDHACLVDKNLYSEHHIHSARLAEDILKKLNFPEEKIKHVKECILSHRGSRKVKRTSLEARILASADAMSHITELPDMFYLTYGILGYKTSAGAQWLKGKFQRSWKKIIPEGKIMIQQDYVIAMNILNKTINKNEKINIG